MDSKSKETSKPDVPEQGIVEIYSDKGYGSEHDEFFHYCKGKSFGGEVAEPFVKEWETCLQHIGVTVYETLHAYDLFQIVEDEQQWKCQGVDYHSVVFYNCSGRILMAR